MSSKSLVTARPGRKTVWIWTRLDILGFGVGIEGCPVGLSGVEQWPGPVAGQVPQPACRPLEPLHQVVDAFGRGPLVTWDRCRTMIWLHQRATDRPRRRTLWASRARRSPAEFHPPVLRRTRGRCGRRSDARPPSPSRRTGPCVVGRQCGAVPSACRVDPQRGSRWAITSRRRTR